MGFNDTKNSISSLKTNINNIEQRLIEAEKKLED